MVGLVEVIGRGITKLDNRGDSMFSFLNAMAVEMRNVEQRSEVEEGRRGKI